MISAKIIVKDRDRQNDLPRMVLRMHAYVSVCFSWLNTYLIEKKSLGSKNMALRKYDLCKTTAFLRVFTKTDTD